MEKKILVTGGAGYIGSHTCKMLKQAGFVPVTYDNLVYGHRDAVLWGPFIKGDLFDTRLLQETFSIHQPIAVIHFAAYAYVGESVIDPGKYYRNNVSGTINLLETMRRNDCSNIIFSSTCATFGIPDTLPIRENSPQLPVNPYGRSKLMIEQILADYDQAYGLKHIVLRYFNAAGADPSAEIGEQHEPETHLIPLVILAALGKIKSIEVYGTDYQTPDGTAIRDYIHVTDLADAHVKALQLLNTADHSESFNLGTGRGTSVREIIDSVERISGKKVPVSFGPRRPGDPPALVSGSQKATEKLKWKPAFSDIDSIIETAWNFHAKIAVSP